MNTLTTAATTSPADSPESESGVLDFRTPHGLRRLLLRLHMDQQEALDRKNDTDGKKDADDKDDGAEEKVWVHDDEVADLMRYCMDKYGHLARKYRQTPEDAAVAAFEVLRARATVEADDPWGSVTRGVKLRLMAEDRADGLLCDQSRARRLLTSDLHEATRFSEYEMDGARSVDTIAVDPAWLDTVDAEPATSAARPGDVAPRETRIALENATAILVQLGWDEPAARACLEYIWERLADAGDTARAFESLRRDKTPQGRFDITQRRWTALCSVVLGHAHHPTYAVRDGLLQRLIRGDRVSQLMADDRLVRALLATCPQVATVTRLGVRCA
ncbi:hypothetical protein GCM10028784_29960 [Myceligenerans cantabricum]